ncbi:hypothetical protein BO70DRAFT_218013 [Aspergillus heteromorphus CBS 117.55]|uniref:Uncharacterized protein n=1 Tax=Aspergillus heteromorphus CBS 117.55 TaxID=1448321 RepID=A0A317WHR4_9EURO|nr:uncharacterized protein BO70DRAFT_218013 [Aspergillus heteromorphus CBS 117.55]PWY85923.1 hypothetical protein BO70DRAFT_218013 [Aspergillus heteromorphus CBS 117.55]
MPPRSNPPGYTTRQYIPPKDWYNEMYDPNNRTDPAKDRPTYGSIRFQIHEPSIGHVPSAPETEATPPPRAPPGINIPSAKQGGKQMNKDAGTPCMLPHWVCPSHLGISKIYGGRESSTAMLSVRSRPPQ